MDQSNQPDYGATDETAEYVAYLDGELDREAATEVESKLTSNPAARTEVKGLEQVWDLLDELPRAETDENFTQTTVALIADHVQQEQTQMLEKIPAQRNLNWMIRSVVAVMVFMFGYLAYSAFTSNPNDQLLSDQPILENLAVYRSIQTLDFLMKLDTANQKTPLFANSNKDLSGVIENTSESPVLTEERSLEDSRKVIEQMSPAEKSSLKRDWISFQSSDEQDEFRKIQSYLATAPNALELKELMIQYHSWFEKLLPSAKSRVGSGDTNQRLNASLEIIQFDKAKNLDLSQEEFRNLMAYFAESFRWDAGQRPPGYMMMRIFISKLKESSDEVINEASSQLRPEHRDVLENFSDMDRKKKLYQEWIVRFGFQHRFGKMKSPMTKESLEDFYLNLNTEEQRRLESLPPEQMLEDLRTEFVAKNSPKQEGSSFLMPKLGQRPSGPSFIRRPGGPDNGPGNRPGGGKNRPEGFQNKGGKPEKKGPGGRLRDGLENLKQGGGFGKRFPGDNPPPTPK